MTLQTGCVPPVTLQHAHVTGPASCQTLADDDAASELLQSWGGLSAAATARLRQIAIEQQRSLLHTAARALQHQRLPAASMPRLDYFFARLARWQHALGTSLRGPAESGPTHIDRDLASPMRAWHAYARHG